jgi:hypothetical protein
MPADDVRARIADRQVLVRHSKGPTSDRGRVLTLDRWTAGFLACAGVLIVAGGGVAAVNSAAPFAHGSWLAAYLVLVGGISQIVLRTGQLRLSAPRLERAVPATQLVLWNVGSLADAPRGYGCNQRADQWLAQADGAGWTPDPAPA